MTKFQKNNNDQLKSINIFYKRFGELGLLPSIPTISGPGTTPHIIMGGRKTIMFGSNNYLGLATNPIIINSVINTLKKHGVGPGGSRILCGNLDIILEFEKKLANFVGVEDTITFPTGYMANLAVFSAVMDGFYIDKNDFDKGIIFSDAENHATIIDGCKLSSAKKNIFPHNNITILKEKLALAKEKNKLIVTESIFSTEGELIDIPIYLKLARKHNALLMVDDAHGLGVLGKHGGGVIDHFNLHNDKPDIVMASFDKSIGTMGGFLGGSKELIDYLRIASRPYLFSSSIPAIITVITSVSLDYIKDNMSLVQRLFSNSRVIREELRKSNFTILGNDKTPVVPVFIGDDRVGIAFEKELIRSNIFAPCFRWPATEKNMSRIRISPMADHTESDIAKLIFTFNKIGKKLKVI